MSKKSLELEKALNLLQCLEGLKNSKPKKFWKIHNENLKKQALSHLESLKTYEISSKDCDQLEPENILKLFEQNCTNKKRVNLEFILNEDWEKLKQKPDIFYAFSETKFGKVLIAFTKDKICFLDFEQDKKQTLNELFKMYEGANFYENQQHANEILDEIFEKGRRFDLFYKGTKLQKEVYEALLNISTLTNYSFIAQQTSNKTAIRAVASYIGKNHIAYLIPCHKVLSKNGKFGGFAYNINLKKLFILHDLKGGF